MAETLDYKVNIDSTNVANQLSAIKNQVDQAMATFSFRSSIPDPQPSMLNFNPYGVGGGISAGVSAAGNAVGTGMTTAQNDARSFMDSTRLGFHKFMVDAQTLALQTPLIGNPVPQINPAQKWMPSFPNTVSGSALRALSGWGYDPAMSMSAGEYSRLAGENILRNIPSFVGNTLDAVSLSSTIVGLGAGGLASIGIGGAGMASVGATAGAIAAPAGVAALGYSAFMSTFGYDVQPTLNMSAYARDTSWRNLSGKFSGSEAITIGLNAGRLQRSDIMMGDRLGIGDVERIMKEVGDTGGFEFARTAEEYASKLKTKVESVRKVMHLLHQSETDAIQTMNSWDRMGISSTTSTLDTALTLSSMAYAAGYTPTAFNQFAAQSVEMIRGTGVSMQAMYLGSTQALSGLKQMARSGAISQEEINQLGGFENAAATINRQGVQWGLSDSGLTHFAAQAYYGKNFNRFGDPLYKYAGAVGQLTDVGRYYEALGALPEEVSKETPSDLYAMQASNFMHEFMSYGPGAIGVKLNKNTYAGYMQKKYNQDWATSMLQFRSLSSLAAGGGTGYKEQASAMNTAIYEEKNVWDIVVDEAGRALSKAFGTEAIAAGFADLGLGIDNFIGDIKANYTDRVLGKRMVNTFTAGIDVFREEGDSLSAPAANRNNNPLNMKMGYFGNKYGAVRGSRALDGGYFAKFATVEQGWAAARDLLTTGAPYKGKTLEQALRTWSNKAYGAEAVDPTLGNTLISNLSSEQLDMVLNKMSIREGYKKDLKYTPSTETITLNPGKASDNLWSAWKRATSLINTDIQNSYTTGSYVNAAGDVVEGMTINRSSIVDTSSPLKAAEGRQDVMNSLFKRSYRNGVEITPQQELFEVMSLPENDAIKSIFGKMSSSAYYRDLDEDVRQEEARKMYSSFMSSKELKKQFRIANYETIVSTIEKDKNFATLVYGLTNKIGNVEDIDPTLVGKWQKGVRTDKDFLTYENLVMAQQNIPTSILLGTSGKYSSLDNIQINTLLQNSLHKGGIADQARAEWGSVLGTVERGSKEDLAISKEVQDTAALANIKSEKHLAVIAEHYKSIAYDPRQAGGNRRGTS